MGEMASAIILRIEDEPGLCGLTSPRRRPTARPLRLGGEAAEEDRQTPFLVIGIIKGRMTCPEALAMFSTVPGCSHQIEINETSL